MNQKPQRAKIISLIDKRAQQGLPTELELTYTIAEEIDYLHDRLDKQAEILEELIRLLKDNTEPAR